jgi:ABC-type polysaccharide/polyol phosphate transport system ATPase subunit
MASVELEQVDLTFRVRQQHQLTLKEYVLKGMFRQSRNPLFEVRALQGVSLRIGDGERVGVLGANGSGKSTLLRLLAGVYHPTAGRCVVKGKVSSLFELALGFEMEATGWKNIRYRGYLQGESTQGIRRKAQAIAEFSELGDFLRIPVRYYSAGMLVRLAFSTATAIEPEVLLVDEVLGAGDLAFQRKAQQRMREMMEQARILVVVSHDLETLPKLCDRALWLDKGRLRADGPVADVIEAYVEHVGGAAAPAA